MRLIHLALGKLAVVMIALTLSGLAQPPDDKSQAGNPLTVTGTVGIMQRDTRQFVLKTSDGREYIIGIDGRTALSMAGGNMNWFDLKEGMDATVTFATRDNHYVATTIAASKGIPLPKITPAQKEPGVEAEPITVKGKVAAVRSDLTELIIRTFDDKDITFLIDDDLRTRIKNGDSNLPKLDKGTEVTATYLVQNGKNKLVSFRDLVIKEQPVARAPTNPPLQSQSTRTTTIVQKPAGNMQPTVAPALPVMNMPLPVGFVATSNNLLGALVGQIVQIKQGMIILTSSGQTGIAQMGAQTTTPTNQTATNPSNQAVPSPNSQATANPTNPIPPNPLAPGTANRIGPAAGGNFFVILQPGSKEPFVADQRTQIMINNRRSRLGEIMEGSRIQATFEMLTDGTRHVTMITATGAINNSTNPIMPAPGQPNNKPTTGQSTTTVGQANNFTGVVVSRKTDSLIVRDANGNDLAFFMDVNSTEPLRADDQTRVQINGQDAKFTDLQVGMQVNVFLELVNNMRRVIGITVGNSTGNTANGNKGLTGNK